MLDDPVGRHIDEDVGHVEDNKGDIELRAVHSQVFSQTVDSGVADVGAIDEGEAVDLAIVLSRVHATYSQITNSHGMMCKSHFRTTFLLSSGWISYWASVWSGPFSTCCC
jgi:hypothetical protein